jgi:hypothetical protein
MSGSLVDKPLTCIIMLLWRRFSNPGKTDTMGLLSDFLTGALDEELEIPKPWLFCNLSTWAPVTENVYDADGHLVPGASLRAYYPRVYDNVLTEDFLTTMRETHLDLVTDLNPHGC